MTNNNCPFFSIITPVYNAESYLDECIKSVINQSFDSWELILVDDGSTDGSGEIIDRYAATDNRIIGVHKENGGEFSARKYALNLANGCYVIGLDADDYYVTDHLRIINEELEKQRVDVIMFSFTLFGDKKGIAEIPKQYIGNHNGDEMLLIVLESTLHSFCSKAIKREIFANLDWSDIPKVKISEDYLMVIPALCNCKSGMIIDAYTYMYRIRENSASNKNGFKQLIDLCEVSKFGISKLKEYGKKDYIYQHAEHLGFLRVFIGRLLRQIKNNAISRKDLLRLSGHESYRNAFDAEKIAYLGKYRYVCMKLFRKKMFLALKILLRLRNGI